MTIVASNVEINNLSTSIEVKVNAA